MNQVKEDAKRVRLGREIVKNLVEISQFQGKSIPQMVANKKGVFEPKK